MKQLPLVCKFTYNYTYANKLKQKPLYALLLSYNPAQKAYCVDLFEESGKTHGRNYHRWLAWDEDTVNEHVVPMDSLPDKLLNEIKEEIALYEEVDNRCKRKNNNFELNL